MKQYELIGFVGQGWIGKNYADDFENRGFETVRYSLEATYVANKDRIQGCDITFIAVPTPTTPAGYDASFLESALENIGEGKIAVIKSTTIPGETLRLQKMFPSIIVLHSPEFLAEKTAAYDAAHPNRNIIGVPLRQSRYVKAAAKVLSVLPKAPYKKVMLSKESELLKYAGNSFLYTKVVFMNMLYDLVKTSGADWETIRDALIADPRIGSSHTNPVDVSGHVRESQGIKRGAGGHCFIKDFETFRQLFDTEVDNTYIKQALGSLIQLNNNYLTATEKDLDLLGGVYGSHIPGDASATWYYDEVTQGNHVQSSSS